MTNVTGARRGARAHWTQHGFQKDRPRGVRLPEVPDLVAAGVISGGMIPKVECCVEAVRSGVHRTHILDGRIPHSILIEVLSHAGIGTMIW